MNKTIKSWDVERGDLYYFGSSDLSEQDQAKFLRKDAIDAIRFLCKKALESDIGRDIASQAYYDAVSSHHGKLNFSVGFSYKDGLSLLINGVAHQVATSSEIYRGKLSVLKELRIIQEAARERNIGSVSSSATLIAQDASISATQKIKNVYDHFVTNRVNELKIPSLINRVTNRVRSSLEGLWGSTDIASVGRNSLGLFAPAAATVFGAFAIAGGSLLSLGGLALVISGADGLGLALLHKSREKAFLAFMDILTGLSAVLTGLFFIIQHGALFAGQLVTAAAAGAALPYAALCTYIASLTSAIYKFYVGYTFRSELKAIVGDGKDPTKIAEALKWIQHKTELSQLDINEHSENAAGNNANFVRRIHEHLHQKWDRFAIRVGREVCAIIHDELKDLDLNLLINELDSGSVKNAKTANGLIDGILEKNEQQLTWTLVSIVSSIIGLAGVIFCLASSSPVASAVSSALFVIAAMISIFVDSPKIRALVWKIIGKIREVKTERLATAIFGMSLFSALSDGQKAAVSLAGRVVDLGHRNL